MNLAKLFRSAALRLIAAYFGIFAVTTLVVSSIFYFQMSAELTKHLKKRVEATHAQLQEIATSEGIDALIKVVEHQSAGDGEPLIISLFTNSDGDVLAGSVQSIPVFSGWAVLKGPQIKFIDQNKSVDDNRYYSLWKPVAGGRLLIGESDEDLEEAQEAILAGLLWNLGITLLITIAGGIWLGRRAQTRILSIDAALEAFARGKLDHRIPLAGTKDDLDQVSARINRTFDRIDALISSMHQISTDIAHDLKTPIGHLKQRLETALQTAKTAKDYRTALHDASGKLDTIVETFEALLRIAQIEAGARKSRFTETGLNDVLANIAEAYEQVGEDEGFKFTTNLKAARPVMIHGDRELLTQLFANLLENAFHHCPPGTEIHIELLQNSHGPVVQITDTGPGIPSEERGNVFRRLYRLEKSRTTPGNGLGLSLVAAIADLHDAAIELSDNEPGLCVSVRFPKVEGSSS